MNFVWQNLSEIVRYFVVVRPIMQTDFAMVPGIVPVTSSIAALWTIWDLSLVAVTTVTCWLALERYGPSVLVALSAATLVWSSVFALLWLGLYNMGLARPGVIAAALPLAWLELAVAALIVRSRMMALADRL